MVYHRRRCGLARYEFASIFLARFRVTEVINFRPNLWGAQNSYVRNTNKPLNFIP